MVEEFRLKIAAAQQQMKVEHEKAKGTLVHSGNKGTSSEVAFRGALASCLPVNLQFGNGEVIDSKGHRSKQTDVVIVSRDHPGTFTPDLPELFYVEAVLAVGEVKSVLTGEELLTTMKNSVSFKQLQVYYQAGALAHGGVNPEKSRYFNCPPFFLFAYESQLALETVYQRVSTYQQHNNLQHRQFIDAVFLLDRGWLINFGDGQEKLQLRSPSGHSIPGWVHQASDEVLIELIRWLSAVMPTLIYTPPIPRIYLTPGGA